MAQIISVDVYDFSTTGNNFATKRLMGLPVPGAFVSVAQSPDPRVYCYSAISYPALGIANQPFLTAETVAEILTKMNV